MNPCLCPQEKRSLPGDREPALKRAFKSFVEERDDKFTMELLLLPSALKEELLGLAHSSPSNPVGTALPPPPGPQQPGQLTCCHVIPPKQTLHPGVLETEQDRSQSSTPVTELSNRILDTSFEDRGSTGSKVAGGAGTAPEVVLLNGTRPSHKRRSSESETRDTKRQYSLERRDESPERARERERHRDRDREGRGGGSSCRSKTPVASASLSANANVTVAPIVLDPSEGDEGEAVSPETNLRCLVNFFR